MKKKAMVLLGVCFLSFATLTLAIEVPCACGPTTRGSFAWAADYNGAPFTWERWIKPIIHITQIGSTTIITVENNNNINSNNPSPNKFKFNHDLYIWISKNKISPDVLELQKILLSEGLLGGNSQTGIYDNATRIAVDKFQHKYNIHPAPNHPYGYFGPLTRAFLNSR